MCPVLFLFRMLGMMGWSNIYQWTAEAETILNLKNSIGQKWSICAAWNCFKDQPPKMSLLFSKW